MPLPSCRSFEDVRAQPVSASVSPSGRVDKKGRVSGHRADSGQMMTPSLSGKRGAFWVKSQDAWGQACPGGAPHPHLGS